MEDQEGFAIQVQECPRRSIRKPGYFACEERNEELPDLILVLRSTDCKDELRVYALGFEDGMKFKFLFSFNHNNSCGMGFVVSGTKLFAVGGDWDRSPKDVKIWDLKNWRIRDEFPMELGQTLGDESDAVVFEFHGLVYALAGTGPMENHKQNHPTFEYLDPDNPGLGWQSLPDPPFLEDYYNFFIKSHSVIDQTLYVGLSHLSKWTTSKYYSYSIRRRTLETLDISKVQPSVKNFMNHCQSPNISPVDENMMVYACRRNMEVYACDLNSEVDEHKVTPSPIIPDFRADEDDASTASDDDSLNSDELDEYERLRTLDPAKYPVFAEFDSDDDFPSESVLPSAFLPVDGFENIRKGLAKCHPNSKMVAHLSGNIYCLIYFFLSSRIEKNQKIKFFTFSVLRQPGEKHSLKAKLIDQSPSFTADMLMKIRACCKLKSSV